MNRRGFLGGLIGVVAAPAVVKAENLMKIWVPPAPNLLGIASWDVTCQNYSALYDYTVVRVFPDGSEVPLSSIREAFMAGKKKYRRWLPYQPGSVLVAEGLTPVDYSTRLILPDSLQPHQ